MSTQGWSSAETSVRPNLTLNFQVLKNNKLLAKPNHQNEKKITKTNI